MRTMSAWRRLLLMKLLLQNFSGPVDMADLGRDMRRRADCTAKELEYLLGYAVDNGWLDRVPDDSYRTTEKGEQLVKALENDGLREML